MVRCVQITGWQKHRGHHTRWASVRLNTALIVSLFWQSLFLSHNQSQCSLHSHCCDYLHTSYYLQAAENMSNTLIHLYLYFWPLKVQYVRLWSFWHHCTVLLMFFNDSVLSRLLFQCTDVVFRWVFSLVRHSSSPGGACELSMNPGRILSSRHPPSQSHNRPVRLISPLTP